MHITVISELPPHRQPQVVSQDTMPKPLTVVVPAGVNIQTTTDTTVRAKRKGPVQPVCKLLPVLTDAKGSTITDSMGHTFIMGMGGISVFTSFTTDNGLVLDEVNCSKTDKDGNLWFGTDGGGVSRYDGKTFTTFSTAQGLAANVVKCIMQDSRGNLWFGTRGGGVSRYDGKTFTNFSAAQGLAGIAVLCIAEDKRGNMWFGTPGHGVSCYDGKTFTNFSSRNGLVDDVIHSMLADRAGNVWIGTRSGLSRYDGKKFTNFSIADGIANDFVRCMSEDSAGNLWMGTQGGLSRYDPSASLRTGSKTFTNFSPAQGLAGNIVNSICEDKKGNLWVGTNNGISCYNPSASLRTGSKIFTSFSTAQGLAGAIVSSITEDKSGNLWFSTAGSGVCRYGGNAFTNFLTTQGLGNNVVNGIAEDKEGNLWFGCSGGGVSRYDEKSFTTFSPDQGLLGNTVYCIGFDKNGYMWFGTSAGVAKYDGKSFTNFSYAQGLPASGIISMASDQAGNLWFGANSGGVTRYDGKTFTTFSVPQGLAGSTVKAIVSDQTGNLWFGTSGRGVSRYDGKCFINFTTAQGLESNLVHSMCLDKAGNLWIATGYGLSVMSAEAAKKATAIAITAEQGNKNKANEKNNSDIKFFKTFTKSDGLPDNYITQILQAPDGKMVVGTNLGVTIFKPDEDLAKLNDIEIYNTNTDCPIKDVNEGQNSMFMDSKGIIWVANANHKTGLVRFDPTALQHHMAPPALVIKSIRVNDENICWHDLEQPGATIPKNVAPAYITEEVTTLGKTLTEKERDSVKHRFGSITFDDVARFDAVPEHLVLPYNYNHVTIEFNAVETGKPNLVNYRYMLEGYDNDWSPVMKKTSAGFGNIREGNYTFMVKAQGPNGVWSAPVTYTFKVLPPWYRTVWAYILYTLFAIVVLYLFFKWRTKDLRHRQKELEQTVANRTAQVVAEKKEAEEQKNRAERSEAFNKQFLANMSHEIRTPMNAVMGMTSLVLDTPLAEKQRLYIEGIKQSSDNLLHIINDILDISKIEAGKMELEQIDFSLSKDVDLVKQTLAYKGEEKGLQLITNIDHNIPDVLIGDPVRLNQVLINLMGNAIKFTEKGSVTIEVKKVSEGVRFSIMDTGIGIPKDKLQTVFENFSQANTSDTRKYGGTGLGLSIARQLVGIMGGSISIESEEGSGTTFSFVIDLKKGDQGRLQQRMATEQQVDGSILDGLNILVVDDNEYNRIVAKDTLASKSKANIVAVGSAQEAFSFLKEKTFDIILMDVQMPGMNGFEATQYIRTHFDAPVKNVPIIALTASVLRTDLDRCRQAGMDSYIAKPFKAAHLIAGIAQVMNITLKTHTQDINTIKGTASNAKATDLDYLRKYCEDEEERIKGYIRMYLNAAGEFEDKAKTAIESKDTEKIAALMHLYKPKWTMMGMAVSAELGQQVELLCAEKGDENKIAANMTILIEQNRMSIAELG